MDLIESNRYSVARFVPIHLSSHEISSYNRQVSKFVGHCESGNLSSCYLVIANIDDVKLSAYFGVNHTHNTINKGSFLAE